MSNFVKLDFDFFTSNCFLSGLKKNKENKHIDKFNAACNTETQYWVSPHSTDCTLENIRP